MASSRLVSAYMPSEGFTPVPCNDHTKDVAVEPIAGSNRRRKFMRIAAGLAVGIAATGAVAMWQGRCVPLAEHSAQSVTSFVETYPSDMMNLVERDGDEDAVRQWLAAANSVGQIANEGAEVQNPMSTANDAIQKAMSTNDPAEAKRVIEKAMHRNVAVTVGKRRELKKFIASHRRGLKGEKKDPRTQSPQQQAFTATCVFDSLQATNSLAWIAANFNDALRTCHGELNGKNLNNLVAKNNTKGKVCAINIGAMLEEFANLAAMLSLAANDCAATLVPNVDALCAASVTGLVYSVSQMAAGGVLMAASCNNKFVGNANLPLEPGIVTSNVGDSPYQRRLEAKVEPASAPARQLLFGGGKSATATECAIEVSTVMWSLAKAALYINSAADGNIGPMGKCPPTNMIGGTKFKGPFYQMSQAYCAQNVGGILMSYSQAITFIQLAIVSCQDTLNLHAICGAGITAIMGSLAGIATTGSGLMLACDTFQDPLLKKALNAASKIDNLSGNSLSKILGGGKALGRRLQEGQELKAEDIVDMSDEEMERHFKTPEAALKSIGIDLSDPNAEFRKGRPPMPNLKEVVSLVDEGPEHKLFGSASTCSV
mmetsp:Transcript_103959/g.298799  ORF Transcript_103959/g.298799 Transcript_103959/m.298799 type:complete len:599 (-) Transcript_103959:401-2197(-)